MDKLTQGPVGRERRESNRPGMNMHHLTKAGWLLGALLVLLSAGCSSNHGNTFQTLTSAQTTIVNGAAATLTVTNNLASVSFPANCFSRSTIALISTDLAPASAKSATDPYLAYYPTTTKA